MNDHFLQGRGNRRALRCPPTKSIKKKLGNKSVLLWNSLLLQGNRANNFPPFGLLWLPTSPISSTWVLTINIYSTSSQLSATRIYVTGKTEVFVELNNPTFLGYKPSRREMDSNQIKSSDLANVLYFLSVSLNLKQVSVWHSSPHDLLSCRVKGDYSTSSLHMSFLCSLFLPPVSLAE